MQRLCVWKEYHNLNANNRSHISNKIICKIKVEYWKIQLWTTISSSFRAIFNIQLWLLSSRRYLMKAFVLDWTINGFTAFANIRLLIAVASRASAKDHHGWAARAPLPPWGCWTRPHGIYTCTNEQEERGHRVGGRGRAGAWHQCPYGEAQQGTDQRRPQHCHVRYPGAADRGQARGFLPPGGGLHAPGRPGAAKG